MRGKIEVRGHGGGSLDGGETERGRKRVKRVQ